MGNNEEWLKWAVKLQAIAQSGLYYAKDQYDLERYEEIRDIAADMLAYKTEIPKTKVKDLFCCEFGYQTPKLATRVAVFRDDKILLVKENNGTWSMPGGWADVDISVKESAVKEVYEEAGLTVSADYLIAALDREKHNLPVYAYKICIFFVMCTFISGEFIPNSETTESGYFSLDELPLLATEKNTYEEIKMCFDAHNSSNWQTIFD